MKPATVVPHARSLAAWLLLGLLLSAAGASAHEVRPRVPLLPLYRQECGACHLAYPVSMLPAVSWRRIMTTLTHHYGSDASLSSTEVRKISAWLQAHAGTFDLVREPPPGNRITRSAWFLQRHGAPKITPAVWRRPAIRSPANCAACHTQTERGSYLEHDTRIPR